MPNITWLLERNVFDDGNPERIAAAVRIKEMPVLETAFELSSANPDELIPVKPIRVPDEGLVFVYGSMNLMKWLLAKNKWPKLAWYNFPRLRCQNYYAHWGQFLLQRKYAFLPLAEIARRKDWVFQTFASDESVFIRPDDNAKSFSGGLVRQDQFEGWYRLANFYQPGPDCLAVVSSPEMIHAEWRLVVANRRVITGSQYRLEGAEQISSIYPPEAAAFAELIAGLNEFNPHPVYVMDVAKADTEYRLVEIGSVCCASLYACDIDKIVDAISAASTNTSLSSA